MAVRGAVERAVAADGPHEAHPGGRAAGQFEQVGAGGHRKIFLERQRQPRHAPPERRQAGQQGVAALHGAVGADGQRVVPGAN